MDCRVKPGNDAGLVTQPHQINFFDTRKPSNTTQLLAASRHGESF
jgi:hypothetical protein